MKNEHFLYKKFCNNQIAGAFTRSLSINEDVILIIPGGPCLSNQYLNNFMLALSQQTKTTVGMIDLPNHGHSILINDGTNLSYNKCLTIISKMIFELSLKCKSIVLFGQSLGARLAFDLLSLNNLRGCFLTGLPYKLQISSVLLEKINNLENNDTAHLDSPEETYVANWKRILPFYTYASLSAEEIQDLTSNIDLKGNEKILEGASSLEDSVKLLTEQNLSIPIAILQGDSDWVVPDNNFVILKTLIPKAKFYVLDKCGHFPMIEQKQLTLECFIDFYSKF